MRRSLAVTLTAAAIAGMSLNGCYLGPSPVQYAALAVIDDRATAVVAACGHFSVSVTVYLVDGGAHGEVDRSSFKDVPLKSIDPNHLYDLDSSTGGPEGAIAPTVRFTTDDLRKIGAGQVLSTIDHEHSKVVSRTSFINERCR